MTIDDIISELGLVIPGGAETTRTTLARALDPFSERHDLWEQLAADPRGIPTAVEELLRWITRSTTCSAPSPRTPRSTAWRWRAGDRVALVYPSANRDEGVFAEPDELDLGRDPNPHIAFGFGTHFCLGAHVARLDDARRARGADLAASPTCDRVSPPPYEANVFVKAVERFDLAFDADERRAATWVGEVVGSPVRGVEPIGKGASRRIWRVELDDGRAVVVREDTGAGPVAGTAARPARARRPSTAPSARRRCPSPASGRLARRQRAPARARRRHPRASTPTADRRSRDDHGRQLGCLHGLDPQSLDLGPVAGSADDLGLWRSIAEHGPARGDAAAAAALEWLRRPTWPPTRRRCATATPGPATSSTRAARVTALLDWEFAHVGDPHDDLAWVAVRNQVLRRPLDLAAVYGAGAR